MKPFPLVSATGMLGLGFRAESLDKAIALGARMIGCDAGSTDPGPGPLATGTCMFSAAAVKRDTEIIMTRAIKAGIPLIIGSPAQGDAGSSSETSHRSLKRRAALSASTNCSVLAWTTGTARHSEVVTQRLGV
jgi:hypothetical protein